MRDVSGIEGAGRVNAIARRRILPSQMNGCGFTAATDEQDVHIGGGGTSTFPSVTVHRFGGVNVRAALRYVRDVLWAELDLSTTEGYRGPAFWREEKTFPKKDGQHAAILQNFTNAVLQGEKLIAPAEEGLYSLELINAMLLASFRDRTVELPVSSAEYAELLGELVQKSKTKKQVRTYQGSTANYLT